MKTYSFPQANSTLGIVMSWVILFFLILLVSPVQAVSKDRDFDHFSTGFPLSGAHNRVDCEACHIRGVFKGTPKQCGACHNGRISVGKNAKHITSTDNCDDCHTTFSWDTNAVDHASVMGDCKSCHQLPARGHVATTSSCDSCHNTLNWNAARFDHSELNGKPCSECHTKTPKHITVISSAPCDGCHTSTVNWQNVRMDHAFVTGSCETCHEKDRPPLPHVQIQACGACHNTNTWAGATGGRHEGVTGNCVSCHNGAPTIGKSAKHINSDNVCENCHKKFTSFSPVTRVDLDHGSVIGNCDSAGCHAGEKEKVSGHVVTTGTCDKCHRSRTSWTASIKVDHGFVSGACSTCHTKPPTHFTGECDVCHRTTGWNTQTYSHSASEYPRGHNISCNNCHRDYITDDGVYRDLPQFANFCAGCHAGRFQSNRNHIGNAAGTVAQNKNCGGSGCHSRGGRGF